MQNILFQKNILLGVCGSISAYKSATLVRLLIKSGANVKVIMTPDACEFITPLTLATLSKNPVYTQYFEPETGVWSNHVELGLWADIFLIAPISANTLAKMATGICDNLLTAVYLSAKCPVYYAPAMDLDMWKHESTQTNVSLLSKRGNTIINPGSGELASGLNGEGRLAEPETIVDFIVSSIEKTLPLKGKHVLVTAGPTYEPIDPVRFIGNHSSGKMGFEIADQFAKLGAEVTLISGPSHEQSSYKVNRINVQSAADMLQACLESFPEQEIIIMAAAVADYTPVQIEPQKIKKSSEQFDLALQKTTDILFELGKLKQAHQLLIGFALETNNEETYAIQKLQKKNLDLIILNSLNDQGAGFKTNTNKITIYTKSLAKIEFPLKTKKEVAQDISQEIIKLLP